MTKKIQVLVIHGGMTFKNKKDYLHYWKTKKISITKKPNWAESYLNEKLGKNFQIIRPRMPMADDAKYEEWKLYFERLIPHLTAPVILMGNSLGGIFLAKYLSENKFPKKLLAAYLVCAPFDDTCPTEDLVGGFKLKNDLSLMEKNTKNLRLIFSADDPDVPVSHAEKYRKKLKGAKIVIYKSKNGHFDVPTFPEIIKMIKEDVKTNGKL